MSARLITATSVVPPPMSQTMLATGSAIGSPTPMAAALASGMKKTWRRRPGGALLYNARFSTGVMQPGAADQHAWLAAASLCAGFAEEIAQHRLAQFEVGDHAFSQRADDRDRAGRAAEHLLGQMTDGATARENAMGLAFDGHDRRFVQHETFAGHADQRVGCTEIDRQIASESPEIRLSILARSTSRR